MMLAMKTMTSSKIFCLPLRKKYCANFADTEETCNRGTSCLFEHALFPSEYHEDDIAPMIKFIDDNKDLAWDANVTVPVISKK